MVSVMQKQIKTQIYTIKKGDSINKLHDRENYFKKSRNKFLEQVSLIIFKVARNKVNI